MLYKEVHPLKAYGKACIQKRFLKTLQTLLPTDCYPILITDAEFLGPWFRAVQKLGGTISVVSGKIYYAGKTKQVTG